MWQMLMIVTWIYSSQRDYVCLKKLLIILLQTTKLHFIYHANKIRLTLYVHALTLPNCHRLFELRIHLLTNQFRYISLIVYCIWVYVKKWYSRLYLSSICMTISGRVFKILRNNTLNKLIIFLACIYYPWDILCLEEIWLMLNIFVYLDTYWCKLSLDK